MTDSHNKVTKPIKSLDDCLIPEIDGSLLFKSGRDEMLILYLTTRKILTVDQSAAKLLAYLRLEFCGKELWERGLPENVETNIAGGTGQ